jgi:hypothetical protein
MKKCSRCNVEKPLDCFYKDRSAKDGLNHKCNDCSRILLKQYRRANPEKASEQCRRYRQANPEKIKQYYQNNKNKKREYYQNNREKILKNRKQYRENNIKLQDGMKIIYGVLSKCHNSVVYVGETSQTIKARISEHKYDALGRNAQSPLWNHIREYGWDDLEFFEICKTHPELNETTEHDAAEFFNAYDWFNHKPCNGSPKE